MRGRIRALLRRTCGGKGTYFMETGIVSKEFAIQL